MIDTSKATPEEQRWTSTGDKLLLHPQAIKALIEGRNHPITLHVMPTEICNLRCDFCSVGERGAGDKLHPDLLPAQIMYVVEALRPIGLKAVILSGGGDPTLYRHINALIENLHSLGLEIGMITNGVALRDRVQLRDYLSWIRISMNTLDYRPFIDIPPMGKNTALGFSYIMNHRTTPNVLEQVRKYALDSKAQYIRLLPDCNLPTEDLDRAHEELARVVKELGPPFFHQRKTHRTPPQCHLGRVHPVLYTDGYIYPCDSVVLNSPVGDRRFHKEYAICSWDRVASFYSKPFNRNESLVDTKNCPHCVFFRQNELLGRILEVGAELPEPPSCLTHKNFV